MIVSSGGIFEAGLDVKEVMYMYTWLFGLLQKKDKPSAKHDVKRSGGRGV